MPKLPPQRHDALAGLFGEDPTPTLDGAALLPLAAVDPNPAQARQVFDATALAELAASIAAHGVVQPIVVRAVGNRWQVVAGERRTRAAKMAGLTHIPALVKDYTDQEADEVTALENLQREDLTIADEGRAYQALLTAWDVPSQRALADRLHISHNRVSRALRLLPYPSLCQQLAAGDLTLRQALTATRPEPTAPVEPSPLPRTDRADLDVYHRDTVAPGPGAPLAVTWRPVGTASKALARLLGAIAAADVIRLPSTERGKLLDELAVIEETAAALRQALEAD